MKKIILSVLSFVMLLSMCLSNAFALENSESSTLSQEVIDIADKYIENEENRLILTCQDELKSIIGINNFNAVIANVEFCNQLLEKEIIDIKENGTLYIDSDDELTIQGGNINATRLYWWGWHRYNDNANTKKIIKEFRKQVKYSNSRAAEIIFGSLAAVPGGFVLSSIPKLLGGTFTNFANELSKKNKGYGTIIAANWVVAGSNIKSQTKNTK